MALYIKSILKQIAFWFLFFAISRTVFLIYYSKSLEGIDFLSILSVYRHAIRLDFSTICYIIAFPLLILTFQSLTTKKWANSIIYIYTLLVIFVVSLIYAAEIGIYDEWQSKLSSKAINYLSNPSEIYNSASTLTFFFLLVLMFVQFFTGLLIFRKWFFVKILNSSSRYFLTFLFFLTFSIVIGIGIRGGVQEIPINQSKAYFSKYNILNLAAVNSGWNIIHSIHQNFFSINKNPFNYYSDAETKMIVENLHFIEKDTTVSVLKTRNPNIVMIILEGWSADLIESLGGHQGITPCFHELEKTGILFKNAFSSGMRSEQGLAALFSGFPSNPLAQITRQPDKFVKLASFPKILTENNYSSSFYFGGDLSYGNIKSYIYFNNFQKIIEGSDFSGDTKRGKLGIHDEDLYPEFLKNINKSKNPFFAACFTLSTHSPYDIPNFKQNILWPETEKEYVNSAFYADSCLGKFIADAKKQKWFSNTLFIIVADHSHSSYRNFEIWQSGYQRIPFLFYGEVIQDEFKGSVNEKICSQVDLAATLLAQLGIENKEFYWSKNIFNPYAKPFAMYSFEVGFGWICPEGEYVYEHNLNKALKDSIPENKKPAIEKTSKSYLQQVYQTYMEY